MITIDQVRLLEQRVQKIIGRVTELRAENITLHEQLQNYQERIEDLEHRIEGFASNQEEIEAGILSALQRLDEVEDAVGDDDTEQRQIEAEPETETESETEPDAESADQTGSEMQSTPSLEEEEEEEAEGPAKSGPELDIF